MKERYSCFGRRAIQPSQVFQYVCGVLSTRHISSLAVSSEGIADSVIVGSPNIYYFVCNKNYYQHVSSTQN